MTTHHNASITWHAELRPDAYGQKLYITLTGDEHLLDYERREHIVDKLHAVRDFLDAEGNHGRERHCTIDHHAMQEAPGSVVLMGTLRDLEDLKAHFDMPAKRPAPKKKLHSVASSGAQAHEKPTAQTLQRSHLRLVAYNGATIA